MGGADVGEVAAGGLNVVVVAGDPGLMELVELLRGEKAHGGAQVDFAGVPHGLEGVDGLLKVCFRGRPAGGYDGEPVHPLPLV